MSNENRKTPSIIVDGLCHYFGNGEMRKQVLFDNKLTINRGEIVIMTGPSGSGKTTLLTLIGTLRTVLEGSLNVLGEELYGIGPEGLTKLRKQIGFIFQAHNLFGSLTAFQNVRMATELAGMDSKTVGPEIEQLLTRLGLGERIHYKPKSLSGGQKQRVAVARGLIHKPKIILADEPTAALDAKSGREAVTIFREMADQLGCTILIVTHDNRILDVADRIINMVDGHIKRDNDVKQTGAVCEFLRKTEFFADLTPQTLMDLANQIVVREFSPGTDIVVEGQDGFEFFMITEGKVRVTRDEKGKQVELTEFGSGDFFGEVALIKDQPRNATVTATEPTVCYVLDKEDFREVIDSSDTFDQELRKAMFSRI